MNGSQTLKLELPLLARFTKHCRRWKGTAEAWVPGDNELPRWAKRKGDIFADDEIIGALKIGRKSAYHLYRFIEGEEIFVHYSGVGPWGISTYGWLDEAIDVQAVALFISVDNQECIYWIQWDTTEPVESIPERLMRGFWRGRPRAEVGLLPGNRANIDVLLKLIVHLRTYKVTARIARRPIE